MSLYDHYMNQNACVQSPVPFNPFGAAMTIELPRAAGEIDAAVKGLHERVEAHGRSLCELEARLVRILRAVPGGKDEADQAGPPRSPLAGELDGIGRKLESLTDKVRMILGALDL